MKSNNEEISREYGAHHLIVQVLINSFLVHKLIIIHQTGYEDKFSYIGMPASAKPAAPPNLYSVLIAQRCLVKVK